MRVAGRYGAEDVTVAQQKLLEKTPWTGRFTRWVPRRQWSLNHWRFFQSGNGRIIVSLGGEVFTWGVTVGRFNMNWDCDPGYPYERFEDKP